MNKHSKAVFTHEPPPWVWILPWWAACVDVNAWFKWTGLLTDLTDLPAAKYKVRVMPSELMSPTWPQPMCEQSTSLSGEFTASGWVCISWSWQCVWHGESAVVCYICEGATRHNIWTWFPDTDWNYHDRTATDEQQSEAEFNLTCYHLCKKVDVLVHWAQSAYTPYKYLLAIGKVLSSALILFSATNATLAWIHLQRDLNFNQPTCCHYFHNSQR